MAVAVTGARASAVEALAPEPASEAARDLFERHGPAVLRFCRSRLRSREEAEDARQTTFLHALRALAQGVVPISELSWLLKIADNVCRTRRQDARRRFAVEVTEDPAELGRIAAPVRSDVELLMPLGDALDRLTEPQRHALLLREWQGLSYKEIAAALGIGQGAVEVLLFRARRALAEELETPGLVRRRRVHVRALDLGWLAGAIKQLLGGATAIGAKSVLTAVAVAIAAAASTVAIAVGPDRTRPAEPSGSRVAPPALPEPDGSQSRAARSPQREQTAPARSRPAAPEVAPQRDAPRADRTAATSQAEPESPAKASSEPAAGARAAPRDPVDEVVGSVSETVEPLTGIVAPTVAEVTDAVEGAVGTVESTVDDVVETTEAAVTDITDVLAEPALPPPPQLP
jgi:RNA polymerase sigma-70 factor (ECF subfamily)